MLKTRVIPCLDGRVVKGVKFVDLIDAGDPVEPTNLDDDARAVSIPVIASGGVSSLDDLKALKACGAKLDGVISGRALYDGRIDVAEAIAVLAGRT